MTTTNTGRAELKEESRLRREAKAAKQDALRRWMAKNPELPVQYGAAAVGLSKWEAARLARIWGVKVPR